MTTSVNYISLNDLVVKGISEEFLDTKFIYIYFEENKIRKNTSNNYKIKPVYFKRVENNNNVITLSHEEILQGGLRNIKKPIIILPKNQNICLNPKRKNISCIAVDLRQIKECKGPFKYYKCVSSKVNNNMAAQIRKQIIDENADLLAFVNNDNIPKQRKPKQTKPEQSESEDEEQWIHKHAYWRTDSEYDLVLCDESDTAIGYDNKE